MSSVLWGRGGGGGRENLGVFKAPGVIRPTADIGALAITN